ncbi:hypothetical protein C4D60_Mb00t12610 [Musa balbisiana]|uniref:Uncharacterized protein n=1 Tax=Musa balbisiana TaxID=52838 RepID=A0A4S8I752_MUSBA|nr:hypothetical protein C4D60_Mb00t12610 [Musa balbisiana]
MFVIKVTSKLVVSCLSIGFGLYASASKQNISSYMALLPNLSITHTGKFSSIKIYGPWTINNAFLRGRILLDTLLPVPFDTHLYFWEWWGCCVYFLIGFWFTRPVPDCRSACPKVLGFGFSIRNFRFLLVTGSLGSSGFVRNNNNLSPNNGLLNPHQVHIHDGYPMPGKDPSNLDLIHLPYYGSSRKRRTATYYVGSRNCLNHICGLPEAAIGLAMFRRFSKTDNQRCNQCVRAAHRCLEMIPWDGHVKLRMLPHKNEDWWL